MFETIINSKQIEIANAEKYALHLTELVAKYPGALYYLASLSHEFAITTQELVVRANGIYTPMQINLLLRKLADLLPDYVVRVKRVVINNTEKDIYFFSEHFHKVVNN